MTDTEYRAFVQNVIDNVKKHGFPDKKVAFPLEQLYEAAEEKGLNFNKVLETLDGIQIAHTKTPEKIIFYPKDREPPSPSPRPSTDIDMNLSVDLDPAMLENMDLNGMMQAAAAAMKNMSPEQLQSIKSMYDNLSDEERAAMIEQARKLGLL